MSVSTSTFPNILFRNQWQLSTRNAAPLIVLDTVTSKHLYLLIALRELRDGSVPGKQDSATKNQDESSAFAD